MCYCYWLCYLLLVHLTVLLLSLTHLSCCRRYESQEGKKILRPQITRPPSIGLVDYIVKQRLFNLYLTEGCVPLTDEHVLMKQIAEHNPWPKPLAVMGYDNTVVIGGGDTFEAETLCVSSVGMGQIASAGD